MTLEGSQALLFVNKSSKKTLIIWATAVENSQFQIKQKFFAPLFFKKAAASF
jgi:hypothetical protein